MKSSWLLWTVDREMGLKMDKTNAARILDKQNISYSLAEYEVDPDDLSVAHVAREINVPASHLFKTLVLRGDRSGIFVCVINGESEVDLKKAAKISGNKKADMVAMKELLPLTGYIRGGCTAIGMKKNYPVFLDQNALELEKIYVSAGKRGLQIIITPQDYIKATQAKPSDLIID